MKTARGSEREYRRKGSYGILRWFSLIFLLAGMFAMGYVAYFYVSAYAFQKIETIALSRAAAPDAPPIGHIIPEGGVMGRVEIGRIGLSAIVVEGDSPSVLRRAVGHVPNTAVPGEIGNIALTGHRDTFFRSLQYLQPGDLITFETTGGQYQFAVESTSVVSPTETEVLKSSGDQKLTLVTCYPFYFVGPAPKRFVVQARRVISPSN